MWDFILVVCIALQIRNRIFQQIYLVFWVKSTGKCEGFTCTFLSYIFSMNGYYYKNMYEKGNDLSKIAIFLEE